MKQCNIYITCVIQCTQEWAESVLTSTADITQLIECVSELPYAMSDWRCSDAVIKCLLSMIVNSQRPHSDTVSCLSSWAMVCFIVIIVTRSHGSVRVL